VGFYGARCRDGREHSSQSEGGAGERLCLRAFIAQREALAANQSVLRRLAEIDKTLLEHDAALRTLWSRLKPLLVSPPEKPAKEMGFHTVLRRP